MAHPNPTLDVTSNQFDPLLALYSDIVPDRRARAWDNMQMIESAIHRMGDIEKKLTRQSGKIKKQATKPTEQPSTSSSLVPERRFLPHQMPIRSVPKIGHNILGRMENHTGPLNRIHEYMKSQQRIRIAIRRRNGIRGHVTGVVDAFDVHWNITLKDAVEIYNRLKVPYTKSKTVIGCESSDMSPRLKELGIELPLVTVKNLGKKHVQCTRKIPQILIRGEIICMISLDN